jgi:hypothetical protein
MEKIKGWTIEDPSEQSGWSIEDGPMAGPIPKSTLASASRQNLDYAKRDMAAADLAANPPAGARVKAAPDWKSQVLKGILPAAGFIGGTAVGGTLGSVAGPLGAIAGGATGAGLGAGLGEAGNQVLERFVPGLGLGDAPQTSREAAGRIFPAMGEATTADLSGSALGKAVPMVARKFLPEGIPSSIPSATEELLRSKGISPSLGERATANAPRMAAYESKAAQTGIAQNIVQNEMAKRNSVITPWANQLAGQDAGVITDATIRNLADQKLAQIAAQQGDQEAAQAAAQSRVGSQIQDLAERLVKRRVDAEALAKASGNEELAQAVSGVNRPQGPIDAGENIIAAVRNKDAAVDAMEQILHEDNVKKPARALGVQVTWPESSQVAGNIYDAHKKAMATSAGSPYSAEAIAPIRRMAAAASPEAAFDSAAQQIYGKDFNQLTADQRKDLINFKDTRPQDWVAISGQVQSRPADIDAALNGRTAVLQTLRKLQRTGESNMSTASLGRLAESMTNDIGNSLPPDLRVEWNAARAFTKGEKAKFNSDYLKGLLRDQNPEAPEKVFAKVVQTGNETDATNLMRLISGDKEAVANLRRGAADYVLNNSETAADALSLLQKKPGIKAVLGDQYEPFFANISQKAQSETLSPGEDRLRKFLNQVIGAKEPSAAFNVAANARERTQEAFPGLVGDIEKASSEPGVSPQFERKQAFLREMARAKGREAIIDGASKNVETAARLKGMLANQPEAQMELGNAIYRHALDNATSSGPFGSPGSNFDPVKFYQEFQAVRPSLARFRSEDSLHELDQFAEAMRVLKLSSEHGEGVASSFHTLGIPKASMSAIGSLGLGIISGHPVSGAAAALGLMANEMTPNLFMRLSLKPGGAKFLLNKMLENPGAGSKATGLASFELQRILSGPDDKGSSIVGAKQPHLN